MYLDRSPARILYSLRSMNGRTLPALFTIFFSEGSQSGKKIFVQNVWPAYLENASVPMRGPTLG